MSRLALLGGKKIREKPFFTRPVLGEEEKKLVLEVLDTGLLSGFIAKPGEAFLGGPKVRKLEEDFQRYFAVRYAIAVNSATAGLHCAVAALGIGPGDEVIVTPYTMDASASAILMANAIPVFVDIKQDTFCLASQKIQHAITPRTKAIIVVHLFGQAANMDEIMKIARLHKLKIIEDCAQSPGAKYKGKFTGTIGDAGVFSFNQHKTITTGEGGMVVTNNPQLAQNTRLIRNHGAGVVLGWNYRMTELEAAVGIAQFKKLDFLTETRIELAQYLTDELRKLAFPGIELPVIHPWNKHVYFLYPIKFKKEEIGIKRETFIEAMRAEGIPVAGGYIRPLYLEPMYQKGKLDYNIGLCPVAEKMYSQELMTTGVCRYPTKKNDIKDVVSSFNKIIENIKELIEFEEQNKKNEYKKVKKIT